MPKTNGYALFLYEQGRRNPPEKPSPDGGDMDFGRLQRRFDQDWHRLSQAEKDGYKQRARSDNPGLSVGGGPGGSGSGPGGINRYHGATPGCVGVSTLRVSEQKELEAQMSADLGRRNHRRIRRTVERFAANGRLHKMKMLVMDVNAWAETDTEGDIPAEVSVVEFSLLWGPTRGFHRVLHHGEIPRGLRCEMMQRSARAHKIEVDLEDTNPLGLDKDLHVTVAELLAFVRSCASSPYAQFPKSNVVYARSTSRSSNVNSGQSVERAWKYLALKTGVDESELEVFELPKVLSDLLEVAKSLGSLPEAAMTSAGAAPPLAPSSSSVPPGSCASVAETILEDMKFLYEYGLKCEAYHCDARALEVRGEETDWSNWACSLARARTLALLVCDRLCPMLGLDRVAGRHQPPFKESIHEWAEDLSLLSTSLNTLEDAANTTIGSSSSSMATAAPGGGGEASSASSSAIVGAAVASVDSKLAADLGNLSLDSTLDSTLNTTMGGDDRGAGVGAAAAAAGGGYTNAWGVASRGRGRGLVRGGGGASGGIPGPVGLSRPRMPRAALPRGDAVLGGRIQ